MSICILTEDSRTKSGKAYEVLAKKALGRAKIVLRSLPRGDLLASSKVKVYLLFLPKSRRVSKCVVCVDSHSNADDVRTKASEAERGLARSFGFPVKYVVVVHALESWLLEDGQALRNVLRVGVSDLKLHQIASTCQPDRALSRVCDHFKKSTDDERIAQEVDVNLIASCSNSFKQFLDALKDP